VADGDISPDVAVEVDEDGVEPGDGVEELCDVVVRLNLGGVRVPGEAEALYELLAELLPVNVGVGDHVGVEAAGRAVDLGEDRGLLYFLKLPFHAVADVGHLLADGGRGGRLPVGPRKHRNMGIAVGKLTDLLNDFGDLGNEHLVAAVLQHECVGVVVDVLAGAGEVDEFADLRQLRHCRSLLLEEVLD